MKLHTKSQGLGLLVSDKEIFKVSSIGVYVKKTLIFLQKGQGQPNVIILSNIVGPMSPMLHT